MRVRGSPPLRPLPDPWSSMSTAATPARGRIAEFFGSLPLVTLVVLVGCVVIYVVEVAGDFWGALAAFSLSPAAVFGDMTALTPAFSCAAWCRDRRCCCRLPAMGKLSPPTAAISGHPDACAHPCAAGHREGRAALSERLTGSRVCQPAGTGQRHIRRRGAAERGCDGSDCKQLGAWQNMT